MLLDTLLLAKCDHFLHAESSVASLASYFNPYMKSYFMEPGKYEKVCLSVCFFNLHKKSYRESNIRKGTILSLSMMKIIGKEKEK